jgi:hypothetical protein
MITRVFFREEVMLPHNRRERCVYREPPQGHKPYDLTWHSEGVTLRHGDLRRTYPFSTIEYVEEQDETAVHVIEPSEIVQLAERPATKRGRKS